MKHIFFLVLIVFTTKLLAQTSDSIQLSRLQYIDVVKMKSGSLYQGHIKKISETTIDMQILGGFVVYLNQKDIQTIEQRCLNYNEIAGYNSIEKYRFREKGFYSQISGNTLSSDEAFSYSINAVFGKMESRLLGFGGGLGFYSFNIDSENHQKFMPIFGEMRSYLRKKMTAPFVSIKAGYGFLLNKNTENTWNNLNVETSHQGGLFFNPAFGYRFGANAVNFVIDVGFVVQHSKKGYQLDSNGAGINWRKYNFQRWQIGLGILF